MTISYFFNNENFDYEVGTKEFVDKVLELFSENYGIEINSVKLIYRDDWLDFDRLKNEFKQEIKDSFEDVAYKVYLDWRCA